VAEVLPPNRPRVFLIRLIPIGASGLAALPVSPEDVISARCCEICEMGDVRSSRSRRARRRWARGAFCCGDGSNTVCGAAGEQLASELRLLSPGRTSTALSGARALKWRVINTCGTATDTGDSRADYFYIRRLEVLILHLSWRLPSHDPPGQISRLSGSSSKSHVTCVKNVKHGPGRGIRGRSSCGGRVRCLMWDARRRVWTCPYMRMM
jgi:hypothetical protein